MRFNTLVTFGLCMVALSARANLNSEIGTERFVLSGHYHEDSTGMDITINDHRKMMISMVPWEYPNPLMSYSGASYHTTGYFPSAGCRVPVHTIVEFDETDKVLFVEFHQPTMVISGFLGCQFPGDKVEFHQLRVSSDTSQNWQRVLEGHGCGKTGAKADLQKQIKHYTNQCTTQGGKSSTSLNPRPMCWAPDPNDLICPAGECWWRGQFFCVVE